MDNDERFITSSEDSNLVEYLARRYGRDRSDLIIDGSQYVVGAEYVISEAYGGTHMVCTAEGVWLKSTDGTTWTEVDCEDDLPHTAVVPDMPEPPSALGNVRILDE